jgi:hypothetical protein
MRAIGRELPGIASRLLTEFARVSVPAIQTAMPRAFDRPTPFTVSRVNFKASTRTDLRSMVGVPESRDASGRSTSEYMRPGALGAARRSQRKSEFMLARAGHLPAGWVMTPGSFLRNKLDGFGNVPGSYYKQVIRSLQIRTAGDRYFKGVSKASGRRALRMGVASEFFAVGSGRNTLNKGGGWLPPGVYKRTGKGGAKLEQYFKFMPRASYKQRLDLPKAATDAVKAKGPAIWQSVMRDVATRFAEKRGAA